MIKKIINEVDELKNINARIDKTNGLLNEQEIALLDKHTSNTPQKPQSLIYDVTIKKELGKLPNGFIAFEGNFYMEGELYVWQGVYDQQRKLLIVDKDINTSDEAYVFIRKGVGSFKYIQQEVMGPETQQAIRTMIQQFVNTIAPLTRSM